MNLNALIQSALFFCFGIIGMHAQENTTATGGDASGSGGIINYSVGQIVYTTITGSTGSISQGIQQPYEIYVTNGIEQKDINLLMSIFPNPTLNYITLKVEIIDNLEYHLFDNQGKLLENNKVIDLTTIIEMERLPVATYFLKVNQNEEIIKVFKIIKN